MSPLKACPGSTYQHGATLSALDAVDATLQRIGSVVDQVEAKLDPVLRQEAGGEGANAARPISHTPLSSRIDALNDVLLSELARLEYVLARIDI